MRDRKWHENKLKEIYDAFNDAFEEEYGADCSAEFVGKFSCYLMWFKEI